MPASLLEAFSSPSIGGTESLHNPRYELELDRNPGGSSQKTLIQKSAMGLVPSTGRINDNHSYPNNVQMGGMCGFAGNDTRSSGSSISLDNETKCDLHIYHILSCKPCREKLKALLCNDNNSVQQQPHQQ
ncbi:MAG: hypothetical protein WD512_02760, partial [Candidatus Paceibacterota bacterium]